MNKIKNLFVIILFAQSPFPAVIYWTRDRLTNIRKMTYGKVLT